MDTQNNAAKFAFYYMLSLVALIFTALSTGIVIFQIINKLIIDPLETFRSCYSTDALKFAISAIIIAAPIYYFVMREINKNLFSGRLSRDSGVRKWLTYFILFISSVVMIGWMIAAIYNFLDGELTTKFLLKSITSIGIAAVVFSYYFYDIKREAVEGAKDIVVRAYFYGTLVAVIITLIAAFFFVGSPQEARNIKHDENVLKKFNQIDSAVENYYAQNEKMPASLDILIKESKFLSKSDIDDPVSKKMFEYKVLADKKYELCATFLTSNKGEQKSCEYNEWINEPWPHDAGRQCLEQKVDYFENPQIKRID